MQLDVVNADNNLVALKIRGALNVAVAEKLRVALLKALTPGASATLDLDEVDRLDTAGVQLLLAARTWVERHGGGFRLCSVSEVARRALSAAGAAESMALEKMEGQGQ